jgi:hypothetical protein
MDNLTGFWHFKEEFEFGEKDGEARLFQDGNAISGSLIFSEKTDDGDSMIVRVSILGFLREDKIIMNDSGHTVLIGGADDEYLSEEREAILNIQGQIVGSVIDKDAVGGVFVMNKIL